MKRLWIFLLLLMLVVGNIGFGLTKIVVSIYPIYSMVKEVVGDSAEVVLIVPPSANPHTFELSPKDILKVMENTKAYITTGYIIGRWEEQLIKALKEKNVKIIDVSKGIKSLKTPIGEQDPHIWLSPSNCLVILQNINVGLKETLKEDAEVIERNTAKFKRELEDVVRGYRDLFSKCNIKFLATVRPAWRYLAKDYSLKYVSLFSSEETEHGGLTPKELMDFVNTVKEYQKGDKYYIFGDEGMDETTVKRIKELFKGNVEILKLNPGIFEDAGGFLGIMRKNLEALKYYCEQLRK